MGNGRMNANDWNDYNTTHTAGRSREQVFTNKSLKDDYNPEKITIRESRDSNDNPNSTPIIIGCDVTGSMGMIAEQLMRTDLIKVAEEIYNRKPIADPHIAVMAIGDHKTDSAPLQVTQFEASIVLADQMRDLWLEGYGGGNKGESYALAHLFAATKTVSDSWEKRGNKGILFTIGDEPVHQDMGGAQLKRIMGSQYSADMTAKQCIDLALETYEVFHIVLANEGFCKSYPDMVMDSWNKVLPQRVIKLSDVSKLAETIVSTIQVVVGEQKEHVAASWDAGTALVIQEAIKDIAVSKHKGGAVRLS